MTGRQKTVSRILEVKEINKERLESEAGKALERLRHEEGALQVLDATYAETNADLTGKQMNGSLPIHQVELYHTYLKHLAKQIEQQKSIVAIRTAELDAVRKAMIQAFQEQRLFEILHDKMGRAESKGADQREQKQADYEFLSRKAEK